MLRAGDHVISAGILIATSGMASSYNLSPYSTCTPIES